MTKRSQNQQSILKPSHCSDFGVPGESLVIVYPKNFLEETFSFFKVSLRGLSVAKKSKRGGLFSRKPVFVSKCFFHDSRGWSNDSKTPEPKTDLLSGTTMSPFPSSSSSSSDDSTSVLSFPLPPRLPCSFYDKENGLEIFYLLEFEGTPKDIPKVQNSRSQSNWERIFWKKKVVILNRSLSPQGGPSSSAQVLNIQKKTSSKASKMGHSMIEHIDKGGKDQFSTKGVHIELAVDQPHNCWSFGEEITVRTFIDNESEQTISSLSLSVLQMILFNPVELSSTSTPAPRSLSSFRTISSRNNKAMFEAAQQGIQQSSSPGGVSFDGGENYLQSSQSSSGAIQKKTTVVTETICDSNEKFPVHPSTTSTGVAIIKLPPFDPSKFSPTIRYTPFFKVEYIIQGIVTFSDKRPISPIVRLPILLCSMSSDANKEEIFENSKFILTHTGDLNSALSLKNICSIPIDLNYPPDQTYLRHLVLC